MNRDDTGPDRDRRVRDFYNKAARDYDQWLAHYERWMNLRQARERLLSQARGLVLDVGVGTGANLRHYPRGVSLVAIDISPEMIMAAEPRAQALGLTADFHVGDAQILPFRGETFDTVVAALALSSIPDHRRALAEIHRVLKPGASLLVLDHVLSPLPPVRWIQLAIGPITARLAGWHSTRDLDRDVGSAGFVIDSMHRSRLGIVEQIVARRNR